MDDIQRKLALIDRQLVGGRNLHNRILATCPLLFVALGLIAGIGVQNMVGLSVWIWLILLLISALVTILLFALARKRCPPYIIAYAASICCLSLGAIRLVSFHKPGPGDVRNLVGDEPRLATLCGLIVTEPYVQRRDWHFANFMHTDPGSSFYFKVCKVKTDDGWAKVSGTVRVQVDEPVLDLNAGDYIQAYCWLDRFKGPTNPGQFDTARYLARKNIFVAASINSRDSIEPAPFCDDTERWTHRARQSGPAGMLNKLKRKVRDTAARALLGNLSPEEPSRGLLEALLLGYRSDIEPATYLAFRKTGLLHFISLSGMHLGILIGAVWWSCKTAGLMKPARAIVCLIVIGVFLLIVPPRAPTLRAAVIGCVFCVSFFFRRKSNPFNTLSLAAIILLLARPTHLFEAGWQLSFASVLGILLFAEPIRFSVYNRISDGSWFRKADRAKPFIRLIARPAHYVLCLLAVGLGAWLGGAGVLLYHFHTICPLASIWTVVVFPLVAGILITGYLKVILSLLLPSAAALLGAVVAGLADFLIWIVTLIASWDVSEVVIGKVSGPVIVFFYTLIGFAALVNFRRPLAKKLICATMAAALIAFLGATKWQRTHRDSLVMTCLDVGHGQAILARLPGKANVLFDAGSLYKSDVGGRVVVPFMNYAGINRIHSIIISHNDIDHINGIPEIIECCKVESVYANDAFFYQADRWGTAKFLDRRLRENGFTIRPLGKGLKLAGGAEIKVLWPYEQISSVAGLSDNDKSLVSLIEFAGRRILLCSDIGKFVQRELLRAGPNLKADVVVVPHHGSARTLEADFLENLQPDVLICSCGRRTYRGLQGATRRHLLPASPQNRSRNGSSRKNQPKWFYTARDGAITVCVGRDGKIRAHVFAKEKK